MKRLAVIAVIFTVTSLPLSARINILEPWHPGLDLKVLSQNTYQLSGTFTAGEKFWEVPFQFAYGVGPRLETAGRWGLRTYDGNGGASDLLIGVKYLFTENSEGLPRIAGEFAFSLPTGDSKNNIGTGSVDMLVHWVAEKKISDVLGYFGLGIRLNAKNKDDYQHGNIFYYHVGAGYDYDESYKFFGEFKGMSHAKDKSGGNDVLDSDFNEAYIAPGLEYLMTAERKLTCALLFGLTNKSHDLGILMSFNF